ncbi:MAG: NADH:flavin oxidoreductase, partial [bacterium]|nr:NADH:flavin oxidoreductase [bacterium]
LAAAIKSFINDKGHHVPVVSVGKISDPTDAEELLQSGRADIVGMARQLLTDPDWPKKVRQGRHDEIVRCIYCNVCKTLDENFKEVHCFLWPKHMRQAPPDDTTRRAPVWGPEGAKLEARYEKSEIKLSWTRATGDVAGYDIYRAEDGGNVRCIEAVKGARYRDALVLGGLQYTYYVRAYDASGRTSPPSNTVSLALPVPRLAELQGAC